MMMMISLFFSSPVASPNHEVNHRVFAIILMAKKNSPNTNLLAFGHSFNAIFIEPIILGVIKIAYFITIIKTGWKKNMFRMWNCVSNWNEKENKYEMYTRAQILRMEKEHLLFFLFHHFILFHFLDHHSMKTYRVSMPNRALSFSRSILNEKKPFLKQCVHNSVVYYYLCNRLANPKTTTHANGAKKSKRWSFTSWAELSWEKNMVKCTRLLAESKKWKRTNKKKFQIQQSTTQLCADRLSEHSENFFHCSNEKKRTEFFLCNKRNRFCVLNSNTHASKRNRGTKHLLLAHNHTDKTNRIRTHTKKRWSSYLLFKNYRI